MPDPAAAIAPGSEKGPEPLQDHIQMLQQAAFATDAFGPLLHELGNDEGDVDRDIANMDRDQFVAMVVSEDDKCSRAKPPASFMHRAAFVALSEKDLTRLPDLAGAGIFYHNSTNQWHASWAGGNRAPSWGPGLRSEKAALLIALMALWRQYLLVNSGDEQAKTHFQKLKDEFETPEGC